MQEGSVTAIDEETESLLDTRPPSPLIALLGLPATTEVDLFNDTTAGSYWERSNRFDMALDLTAGRRDLAGLGDVIIAGSRICLRSMSRSNLWGRGMEW